MRRLARDGGLDSGDQRLDRRSLEQIAARSRSDGIDHALLLCIDRQNDYACSRSDLGDSSCGLDARQAGHLEIHEHDVRRALRHDVQRARSVGNRTEDLQAFVGQQLGKTRPKQLMVVDDEDVNRFAAHVRRMTDL